MINKDNLKDLLKALSFEESDEVYFKYFPENPNAYLKVDFKKNELIFPEDKGFIINERQTCNFSSPENFVVFECVNRLFEKGYKPEHIELEPKWKVGHGASGGRADILIKDNTEKSFLIIECKTDGYEFKKEWANTKLNGGQMLSYAKQAGSTQYVCLYSSDFENGKVSYNSYIISLNDNNNLLESLIDKKPISFAQAKALDVEDIYNAWKYTYDLYFETKGIFEDDIEPYKVGKQKHKLKDLKEIGSKDIQSKYHEFASIMRRYNVSGRENAFDKLVNLFLCKVVDEYENPDDLKFYWKGIANDSYFELQDRLQNLYQIGMDKFLEEKITNVNRSEIVSAFRYVKKDPDSTQETILKFFRQLKYFKNSDFSFIDVHNEGLFYQNSIVLLDVVRMLQDIRLTSENQNQFLGDMFEGFLDNGVKQSEGQFFTPMPIVKFIIKSLPLENIIIDNELPPKAIDYACGAGHFLNELALQIKPFVEKNKDISVDEYYEQIIGIEKEYRLSKVAKVSAFMYGQDDIKITYADALGKHSKVEDESFSILVANPPYSVKGFLQTLSEEERKKFTLSNSIDIKSIINNNSIETFFIERAKQLLKPDGIAAIILPPSILSNESNIYVKTREIILNYFDIISIVEFGSQTFGKTGTNTVTLFLRKKNNNPSPTDHWKYRVESWFNNNESEKLYEDNYKINQYCNHIGIDENDYKSLLNGVPNSNLLKTEIFLDYKKAFNNQSEIKNLLKQRSFKAKNIVEQEEEIKKRFNSYLFNIEKDKLYFFVIASENKQKVLVVKCGTTTKEQQDFLGYKWSNAKGNEGIKYINQNFISSNIDDEEAKEMIEKLYGLQSVNTPLYNSNNTNDTNKINYYIQQNFLGNNLQIDESLHSIMDYYNLLDLLDFTRTSFNKQIVLTPKKSTSILTKWDLKKLGDEAELITKGTTPTSLGFDFVNKGINFIKIESITKSGLFDSSKFAFINKQCDEKLSRSRLNENDILFSIAGALGRSAIVNKNVLPANTNQALAIIRLKNQSIFINKYIYLILTSDFIQNQLDGLKIGIAQPNLSLAQINDFKIPYPPLEIQQIIVDECSIIDVECENAVNELEKAKINIEVKYNDLYNKSNNNYRLNNDELFEVSIGRRILAKDVVEDSEGAIPVFSANVFQAFGFIKKELIKDFSKPSVLWGIDGDWMVNTIPANNPFYPTDHCGVIRIKTDEIHYKYLAWVLNKEGENTRFSRANRASTDRIKGVTIKAPTIKEQQKVIAEIEKLEQIIVNSQIIIDSSAEKKKEILNKYL